MSRFKVGDKVTPISVKPYSDRIQRRLLGKTLVVYSFQDNGNSFLVFAGVIGDCGFFWHPDDLRLLSAVQPEPEANPAPAPAAPTQQPETMRANWGGPGFLKPFADAPDPTDHAPAATRKPKPIRRGDLVVCRGVLWVVFSTGAQSDGDYWIASLTGDPETYYATICELTRIGSIRKKIKRLKAQFVGDEK